MTVWICRRKPNTKRETSKKRLEEEASAIGDTSSSFIIVIGVHEVPVQRLSRETAGQKRSFRATTRRSGSHRKFIFSQMVAAFSMLSSWLGVSRKAPLVRKSFSLTSESVSPWSCQSADSRRPSWFRRNIELLLEVDMSFSYWALPSCSDCDIFYSVASEPRTEWSHVC